MNNSKDYKDSYVLMKMGYGEYGNVYKGKNKKTNEERAIKIIEKSKIKNAFININLREPTNEEMKSYIDRYLREIDYMKIMEGKNKENRNTIKYYEHFENEDEFAIIMELCDDNLLNFITSRKETFKPEEIFDILNQLNNSFKIMNENKLVHRALNLENILIKYENEEKKKYILKLKLNQYGCFVNDLSLNYSSPKKERNLKYIAPEILKGEEYNEKCDLWSLGVIIYILSFIKNPYYYNNKNELLNEIKKNGQNLLEKTNDSELNDLMSKLLMDDPSKRISWEEYFNHPFFKNQIKQDYKRYYEIIKRIGIGEFGYVYEAKEKETNEKRALKIIDKNIIRKNFIKNNFREMNDEEMKYYIQDFINETKYMRMMQDKENKNTVRFYDYFENENELVIVMELCDENLLNLLEKGLSYNIREIYELLNQLNNTFKIMDKNKILHTDLKLENILVEYENKEKIYKISDYGLGKKLFILSDEIGKVNYMAPEILEGKEYTNKCDLWSLGIIIYQLFFKNTPYNGINEYEVLKEIKKTKINNVDGINNTYLNDLVRKMLVEDPEKRITWKEYFDHPFFQNNILYFNN